MTIRLLNPRPINGITYPANAIITLDAGTESGLIGMKEASSDLTGGFVIRKPLPPYRSTGGRIIDWSAESGALSVASANPGETFALDATVMCDSRPAVKCLFSSTPGTFIGRYTPTNPISFKNFTSIDVPIKITCNVAASNVGQSTARFQLWLKAAGGQVRLQMDFDKLMPNEWALFRWTRASSLSGETVFSTFTSLDDLDSNVITAIDIVQVTAAASVSYPVWIGPIQVNAKENPMISIRMDGEYISQYTLLKPLLDKYGFRVSLALTHSLIGSSAAFMSAAQINEFYASGSECIHHTYDASRTNGYVSATDWPSASDITNDIAAGRANMINNGWTRGIGIIVQNYTPIFVPGTSQARQTLVKDAFRAAGVEVMCASVPLYSFSNTLGKRYPEFSPSLIRGGIQINNTDTPATVQAVIDNAIASGSWVVITIHRAVLESPASLEMSVDNFAAWLNYLKTQVDAGVCKVVPIGEALGRTPIPS